MFFKFFPLSLLFIHCHGLVSDSSLKQESPLAEIPRRKILLKCASATLSSVAFTTGFPRRVVAANNKSRAQDYQIRKSEEEWKSLLSPRQYEILREGGTERPFSSILETEDAAGVFYCAACSTPLFESKAKFHSGTGWPSFATALRTVEVEQLNPLQVNFVGAELRCATCGSHLGDVFTDGWIFQGTPAAESGKRFCVDGSALVFQPSDGGPLVSGDQLPPVSARQDFLGIDISERKLR